MGLIFQASKDGALGPRLWGRAGRRFPAAASSYAHMWKCFPQAYLAISSFFALKIYFFRVPGLFRHNIDERVHLICTRKDPGAIKNIWKKEYSLVWIYHLPASCPICQQQWADVYCLDAFLYPGFSILVYPGKKAELVYYRQSGNNGIKLYQYASGSR